MSHILSFYLFTSALHDNAIQVEELYQEHLEQPYFSALAAVLTSAPVVALQLRRRGAIPAWRHLMGPGDYRVCQDTRRDSLRAQFAKEGPGQGPGQDAVHGAVSVSAAARELALFFTAFGKTPLVFPPGARRPLPPAGTEPEPEAEELPPSEEFMAKLGHQGMSMQDHRGMWLYLKVGSFVTF